jgi:hypothetical protein
MMRFILPAALLVTTSCGQEGPAPPQAETGNWKGSGRDRLCIAQTKEQWRVGVVTFGEANNNCTLRADVVDAEHGMLVQAIGDPACKFLIESDGLVSTFPARMPGACAYYCGPSASLAGKKFTSSPDAGPATDFAGDPLC